MTLVVIVGDYSMFVSKASLRRIDKTNISVVAKFKLSICRYGMTLVFISCRCLQCLLAKQA